MQRGGAAGVVVRLRFYAERGDHGRGALLFHALHLAQSSSGTAIRPWPGCGRSHRPLFTACSGASCMAANGPDKRSRPFTNRGADVRFLPGPCPRGSSRRPWQCGVSALLPAGFPPPRCCIHGAAPAGKASQLAQAVGSLRSTVSRSGTGFPFFRASVLGMQTMERISSSAKAFSGSWVAFAEFHRALALVLGTRLEFQLPGLHERTVRETDGDGGLAAGQGDDGRTALLETGAAAAPVLFHAVAGGMHHLAQAHQHPALPFGVFGDVLVDLFGYQHRRWVGCGGEGLNAACRCRVRSGWERYGLYGSRGRPWCRTTPRPGAISGRP
jgi:hypothetical protein